MVHIRFITPHTNDRSAKLVDLECFHDLPVQLSMVSLEAGPQSIESEFDETLAAPFVVGRAIEAEREGVDAVVIDCMGDPGLHAAREAVAIPVIGPGETCLHLAATLGHRISFVTVLDRIRPLIERRAQVYGVGSKLVSVRSVQVPVLDIGEDYAELLDRLVHECRVAIATDQADVVVLGCTGFVGLAEELAARLRDAGLPVPVISPLRVATMAAFGLVRCALQHSRVAYPELGEKPITGYALPPLTRRSQ